MIDAEVEVALVVDIDVVIVEIDVEAEVVAVLRVIVGTRVHIYNDSILIEGIAQSETLLLRPIE